MLQHGEAEEGDSGLLVREQAPSPWGDGGSDGPSTNNNSVGIMTDQSSECGDARD